MVCRPAARCSRVHARTPRTAGGVGAARRPGRLADARQAGATARSCGLSTWARRLLCPRLCTAAAPLGATTAARGSRTGAAAVGEAAAFRRPNKRRLDRSRARRWSCAISLSDSRPNCDSRFDGQRDRSRHQAGCRSCAHRSRRIVRSCCTRSRHSLAICSRASCVFSPVVCLIDAYAPRRTCARCMAAHATGCRSLHLER